VNHLGATDPDLRIFLGFGHSNLEIKPAVSGL
jgi:hypothetical protein